MVDRRHLTHELLPFVDMSSKPETEEKKRQRLGEILLAEGRISEAQLEEALPHC